MIRRLCDLLVTNLKREKKQKVQTNIREDGHARRGAPIGNNKCSHYPKTGMDCIITVPRLILRTRIRNKESLKWRQATEQGHGDAMYMIGQFYRLGHETFPLIINDV